MVYHLSDTQKHNIASTNGTSAHADEINKLKNQIENYEQYSNNLQYQINSMQEKYRDLI
jgi:hypothetical protein